MNPNDFKEINGAADIDLNCHAVIEASAGTGKTYTLIELVMRLIIDENFNIDQLLLVTFTDQATGELKARIRQRLWEALAQIKDHNRDKTTAEHIENNIALLNQASIFTIHGFCHGALKEFAFEQGAVFEAEKVNDNDVRSMALQQMKRKWPADKVMISQLEKFCVGKKSLNQIDGLLLDLAGKYKPEFDTLFPSTTGGDLSELWEDFTAIELPELTVLEKEFEHLKGSKTATLKKRYFLHVEPFIKQLSEVKKSGEVDELFSFLSQLKYDKKTDNNLEKVWFSGLPKVYDQNKKDNENSHNQNFGPQLFSLMSRMNQLLADYHTKLAAEQFQVIPRLLDELMTASAQYKRERGLISYDDMILQLWKKLKQESELNSDEQLLTQALRGKYQIAIIDEFQDTDIRQWQIFEQIFLKTSQLKSANQKQHRLWVIGDPKQAIYGFRGADIHTYEAAKSTIIEQYGGNPYRLNTNFRTTQALIAELNQFFADDQDQQTEAGGWFAPEAVHVHTPAEDVIEVSKTPQVIANKQSLNALNCLPVELSGADEMKSQLAADMAATIKNQIINQVEVQHKGQRRVLNAADVCILVRGNSDAVFIEEALQQQGIPFTFHKKKDLYQSKEAIHFQVLLTALARPNEIKRVNNALLTLFFGLKAEDLADFAAEKLPQTTDLWLKVKEAVAIKNWILVFDLLLQDSGAMYRAQSNSRRVANLKQLKNMLLNAALQHNFGADALLKYFTQKREKSSDDEDLHHKDTEQQAVKIMTMHISKGLEFPVVFLFGGFSRGGGDSFIQFYDEQRQGMVYDLVKRHQDIYNAQQLKHAEQLYYVAMTRAVFMLFLPFVDESEKPISQPGLYTQTVMARLKATGQCQLIPPAIDATNNIHESTSSDSTVPEYQLTLPTHLNDRRRNLHSFSSLSRFKSSQSQMVSNDFDHSLTAELMQAESQVSSQSRAETESSNEISQAPQIPGGVKTGHVLHGIFEHIDFTRISQHENVHSIYQDDEIMQVIDQQMKLFKLENRDFDYSSSAFSSEQLQQLPQDYRQQLADWTWHTLNKPLQALNGRKLADVSLDERSHELSFFWNHDSTYLTGFIDLFFALPNDSQQEGLTDYFILDWKSNFSAHGYTPEVLENEVMVQHQYNWQYQLYAMAMQQWFDSLGLKNARLKGAIYMFSRGIDCNDEAQNGVFYDDFTDTTWQIDDIKTELLQIDGSGGKS